MESGRFVELKKELQQEELKLKATLEACEDKLPFLETSKTAPSFS